jgi:5-methylcytosine-specific restriction endonuclease McrA
MTYAEKLLDYRWQLKRQEILERDNYTCQRCSSDGCILQVHHLHYYPKHEPWEYENEDLITLCDKCHAVVDVKIPKEEIMNPWIIYSRRKREIPLDLSPREYADRILALSNGLSL